MAEKMGKFQMVSFVEEADSFSVHVPIHDTYLIIIIMWIYINYVIAQTRLYIILNDDNNTI